MIRWRQVRAKLDAPSSSAGSCSTRYNLLLHDLGTVITHVLGCCTLPGCMILVDSPAQRRATLGCGIAPLWGDAPTVSLVRRAKVCFHNGLAIIRSNLGHGPSFYVHLQRHDGVRILEILCASDLLIIDEFGFDKLERLEYPESPSLLYKVIDHRSRRGSTALVTNLDFKDWSAYLGDPPLAMALLDRVVDGAIIQRMDGKSYREYRAQQKKARTRQSKTRKPGKS